MAKYSFDCDMDHDPMHFEVEAEDDDSAVKKLIEELGPHSEEHHPDMKDMSQEDLEKMVREGMHKEEVTAV